MPEQEEEDRDGFSVTALSVVAALSVIAVAPVLSVDTTINTMTALDLQTLGNDLLPLLLLLPLPAAYVSVISRSRFRWETVGGAAAGGLAVLDGRAGPVAAGLTLGLLLVSYKTRSIFTGDNGFWTSFKATSSTVLVLMLVVGGVIAYTYDTSPGLQNDVRTNITAETTEFALEQVDVAQTGGTEQLMNQFQQQTVLVARTTVGLTAKNVTDAVDADGSFSSQQKQVLAAAFQAAEDDVPGIVGRQTAQQLQQQYDVSGGGLEEEMVEAQLSPVVDNLTATTPVTLALIVMLFLSLSAVLKFPFALIGGVYAVVLSLLLSRFQD